MQEDVYFKKTISFNFWKHSLKFRTSQELFSSHEVDLGTHFLLRTIMEADYGAPQNILDVGCGYGPIGLTLKTLHKESQIHMLDKDALAVDYSRQNAELNGLRNVNIYGSLGYDDVTRTDFDLIISNIPGKAGGPVIEYLLREAAFYLAPGGMAAIVVVTPLAEPVEKILGSTPEIETVLKKDRPGHVVFHYRFKNQSGLSRPSGTALERGTFKRKSLQIQIGKLELPMQTAFGLAEFDSLDYRTEMIIKVLQDIEAASVHQTAVLNPGQGHIAVAVWKYFGPHRISLVDRDLLALRYSNLNLVTNGCSPERITNLHQTGMEIKQPQENDLIAGVLREEEGQAAVFLTVEQAARNLAAQGKLILSGSSTTITRLVDHIQKQKMLHILSREKYKGNGLLVLESG
jgi:16S rRNA (guanine1207-N2)-methyltransferase